MEVIKMAWCQECWKTYPSDNKQTGLCPTCRHQLKLTVYMEARDEG